MDLIKKHNLPSYIKDKTFSEASKMINNKFKDRNDKLSLETRDELLERLKMAQESYRNATGLNNSEYHGDGGGLSEPLEDNESFAGNIGAIGGAANTLLDFGNSAFGKTGIDKMSDTYQSAPDNTMNTIGKTMKGVQTGAKFGPIGAAVGGVLGLGSGLIQGGKIKRDINLANLNKSSRDFNKTSFGFANGGKLGDPPIGEDPTTTEKDNQNLKKIQNATNIAFDMDAAKRIFQFNNPSPSKTLNFGPYSKIFSAIPYYDKMGTTEFNPLDVKVNDYRYINNENIYNKIRDLNPGVHLNFSRNYKNGGDIYPYTKYESTYPLGPEEDLSYVKNQIPTLLRYSNIGPKQEETSVNLFNTDGPREILPTPNNSIPELLKYTGKTNPIIPQDNVYTIQDEFNNGKIVDPPNNKGNFNKILTKGKELLNKGYSAIKDDNGAILRYAPAVMNAIQLAKLKSPQYEHLGRLANKYKPVYEDEKQYQNIINSEINSQNENLANATNGSSGAYRSNMLGVGINKIKALNDAYSKMKSVNNAEDKTKQMFDSEIDKINLQQSNKELEINDQNKANYNTQKSKLLAQIGNDLGNVGLEQLRKKYPEMMDFAYNHKGDLVKKDTGEIVFTKEELDKKKNKKDEQI